MWYEKKILGMMCLFYLWTTFAYQLTDVDQRIVDGFVEKIDLIVAEKWESFRTHIISILQAMEQKTSNERYAVVFGAILNAQPYVVAGADVINLTDLSDINRNLPLIEYFGDIDSRCWEVRHLAYHNSNLSFSVLWDACARYNFSPGSFSVLVAKTDTMGNYKPIGPFKQCIPNLFDNGLYCITQDGRVEMNGTPVTMWWQDYISLEWVQAITTYGKTNLYAVHTNLAEWEILTRYRNVIGFQINFQVGTNYFVEDSSFGNIDNLIIDWTFLSWKNRSLWQFWREISSPPSYKLEKREVPLIGWDTVVNDFSDNVKIIASQNSRYVIFFDQVKQSLVVYESKPLKTNDVFAMTYNLHYLLKFQFNLWENSVIDVVLDQRTWSTPIVYLLNQQGIYELKLWEYIEVIISKEIQ